MKCAWCGHADIEPLYHNCPEMYEMAPGLKKAQKEIGMQLEIPFPKPGQMVPCDGPVERFIVKDSGAREQFDSGMVRDTEAGKTDYTYVLSGPMLERWSQHLMRGAEKYERDNWMKATGEAEYRRFRRSALRHLIQWLNGETDEDHAAAVFFNVNGAEYVRSKQ